MMTKTERIKAALIGGDIDRVPVSIWLHYPHKDQDPRSLADMQVDAAEKFDYDFIKLMPFGLYSVQDWGCKVKIYGTSHEPPIVEDYAIKDSRDWETLEVLPAIYGTWGKQLQLAQHISKLTGGTTPFIQTIFSPLTTAKKLAGDRIYQDLQDDPKRFHQALQVITDTTVNFINANVDAGVSGFFFATQNATFDEMNEADFSEFGQKYDLQLFDAFKNKTYFNVIHIHGENTMFEKLAGYPGNCISWHDRWVYPTLGEARNLTDKCLLGGLNEKEVLASASPDEIQTHVAEAIQDAGRSKLMIGPGCVAEPLTPEINYYAARLAAERHSRLHR